MAAAISALAGRRAATREKGGRGQRRPVKRELAEADSIVSAAVILRLQAGEDINLVPISTMTATPDPAPPQQQQHRRHRRRDHHHGAQEQGRSEQNKPAPGRPQGRPMKIRRVPMRHGWYWLIEGFALWVRNPAFLSYLTFGCILAMLAMALLPTAGEALCTLLMPCLTLGVYNGCRAIDRRRKLTPGLLFSGFRRRSFNLLIAGGGFFAAMKGVSLATTLIDGGVLWQFLEYGELDETALDKPAFRQAALALAALLAPSLMAYWFIPQLVGWWRLSVPKALLVSFMACARNWPTFAAYLCIILFGLVLVVFVIGLFDFILPGLGALMRAAFLLLGLPTLFASFYISSRDIFGLPYSKKRRPKEPAKSMAAEAARQKSTTGLPPPGKTGGRSAESAKQRVMARESMKKTPLGETAKPLRDAAKPRAIRKEPVKNAPPKPEK